MEPLPIPTRGPALFMVLLAAGFVVLTFAYLTVHDRNPEELRSNMLSARSHFSITHWLEHGYLRSCGLTVRRSNAVPLFFYQSGTGAPLVGGFLVEKVYVAFTGRYSYRLLALQNQIFAMITASLLGLLGFRLAARFGVRPLHALVLAFGVLAVHFTFPDNLALYWGMESTASWLPIVVVFLLIEERSSSGWTRPLLLAQAGSVFLFTMMEYAAGIAFIASYALATLVLSDDRRMLRRILVTCVAPLLLALTVFAGQRILVQVIHPDTPKQGNGFLFRTGLDGSSAYYTDHLDIAYGREVARLNFPYNRPQLFRWKWLFLSGAAGLIAVLIAASRRRVPRVVVVSLLSLFGAYIVYAAVFSQAVVIHPYQYDVMLFTPIVLTVFLILPALVESIVKEKGVVVVTVFFLALWVSFVQLRSYALRYPIMEKVSVTTTDPVSVIAQARIDGASI